MLWKDRGEEADQRVGDEGEENAHHEEADDEVGEARRELDFTNFRHGEAEVLVEPAPEGQLARPDRDFREGVGHEAGGDGEGDVHFCPGRDGNGGQRLKRHRHHREKQPDRDGTSDGVSAGVPEAAVEKLVENGFPPVPITQTPVPEKSMDFPDQPQVSYFPNPQSHAPPSSG